MRTTVDRGIRLLLAANIVVVVALLAIVVISSFGSAPGVPAQLEPTPSASSDTIPMGLAHIPTTNSCLLCHDSGGEGGLKPIPALGHPIEGWRACGACHVEAELGRTTATAATPTCRRAWSAATRTSAGSATSRRPILRPRCRTSTTSRRTAGPATSRRRWAACPSTTPCGPIRPASSATTSRSPSIRRARPRRPPRARAARPLRRQPRGSSGRGPSAADRRSGPRAASSGSASERTNVAVRWWLSR
jgi:hypothetical protein